MSLQNLLKDVTIKNKLILLFVLPTICLLSFFIYQSIDKINTVIKMNNLEELSVIALKVSSLEHELQRERGLSAVYISSKRKMFSKELLAHRTDTDKRTNELILFIKDANYYKFGTEFEKNINNILEKINNIKNKRNQIDTLTISANQTRDYYNSLINLTLNISDYFSQESLKSSTTMSVIAYAYQDLLKLKDKTGLERSALNKVFKEGHFTPELLDNFNKIIVEQNVYKELFLSFANKEQKAFFDEKMNDKSIKKAKELRTIVLNNIDKNEIGITQSEWFQVMSDKVDLLNEIEIKLAKDISSEANKLKIESFLVLSIFLIITIFTITISIIFAYIVSKSITEPLNKAINIADEIASGNFGIEFNETSKEETGKLLDSLKNIIDFVKSAANVAEKISNHDLSIEVTPRSEMDVLNNSLMKMIPNLRKIIESSKEHSNLVANTVQELSFMVNTLLDDTQKVSKGSDEQFTATEETSAAMEELTALMDHISKSSQSLNNNINNTFVIITEIVNSINKVSNNTEELSGFVSDTREIVSEMVSSNEEIALSARDVENYSKQTFKQAQEGEEVINLAIEGINKISQSMENISLVNQKLNYNSEKINGIIDVIHDLADQTNLLALNAAIESARVGEAGKGFAVVANEIKKLADRSSNSAKEIASLILLVQSDTNNAIKVAEEGVENTKKGIILSKTAGDNFKKIVDSVETTSKMMQEIGKTTQYQTLYSEKISKIVEKIAIMTEDLDLSTKNQSSFTSEILRSMEEINLMVNQVTISTNEQRNGGSLISIALNNITTIAEQNMNMATENKKAFFEITNILNNLNKHSTDMIDTISVFKLDKLL